MSSNPTQKFDPNRTQLGVPPSASDPMKTQLINAQDPLRTMMIPAGGGDPNRTSVMDPSQLAGAPFDGIRAEITASREATMANGPAREQFLVEFTAGGGMANPMGGTRTPLNLCLVIDRSGSMEGPPLDYVKQACCHVVDLLGPNDILSIVTFEEVVDLLMPPQRVTNKQPIKDGIMRLLPGNTTNLFDGLGMAAQQVLSIQEGGRATRLVVLTDGDPTAGIKDHSSLVAHAGEIKNRGITCTFLGFGPDYNEELLASMAKRGGGNYYYIPQPQMIPDVFRQELDKLLTTSARNLQLTVKPARWVSMRAPQSAMENQEVTIPLTDLEKGATLQQVFDFEFRNHPLGWYRVASGRLSYDDLAAGGGVRTVDLDFIMEFTADAARYSVAPNPRVEGAAQVALASRAVEKTVMGLKTGMLTQTQAIQDLQKTQMLLASQGRASEAQEVTMALHALQTGNAGQAEKTLMGTMVNLDQGKKS